MQRIDSGGFTSLSAVLACAAISGCSGTQQPPPERRQEVATVEIPASAGEEDASSEREPEPAVALETGYVDAGDESQASSSSRATTVHILGDSDAGTAGILGLIGDGGVGFGIGGLGVGRRRDGGVVSPGVVVGATKVQGSLDKEIIRRIVRRHVSKFRYCYEKELVKDPNLSARATPKFTIATDGSVSAASLSLSTGNQQLDECLLTAIRSMQFPVPKGGVVVVSYPLVFRPTP